MLEQAGLVHRIVTDGEFARFELAEDLTEHHHHLICANCGLVEDVPASAGLEQSVHTAANQIARSTGFHTQRHRVDLVGLCARCASELARLLVDERGQALRIGCHRVADRLAVHQHGGRARHALLRRGVGVLRSPIR